MSDRDSFRFLDPMRVRWAEVDMQRIVFNGHYLMYFDTAVAGYWRALALPYEASMQALGGDLYVRKATLDYLGSARYDDQLEVGLRCERIGNSSMRLLGAVFRGRERLVGAELVYVFADPATQRPRPLPEPLRSLLLGYEAGEPVLDLRVGAWSELQSQAQPIRQAVFVREQQVPAELEADGADADATHALALNRLGQAVGTARLLRAEAGVCKLGRMAVLSTVRGAGVGSALLGALANAARAQGAHRLKLNAQDTAIGFYRRLGFTAEGATFQEAGITHQTMAIAL